MKKKSSKTTQVSPTPEATPPETRGTNSASVPFTLIPDPFQIPTARIKKEQNREEELDLDEGILDDDLTEEDTDLESDTPPVEFEAVSEEKAEAQMEKLALALAKEQDKLVEQLESIVDSQSMESAEELAKQIAEDLEIEKHNLLYDPHMEPVVIEALPAREAYDPENPEAALSALDLAELQSCLEVLLFLSDKPMPLKKIRDCLGDGNMPRGYTTEQLKLALEGLEARFQSPGHGFELVKVGGGYQFRTKAGRAALAKLLAKVQTQKLSRGAMETLAIVAYKQPVMKEQVDRVRGVDSSHFLRTLLERKLVSIAGRSDLPGRPLLYGTTQEFLEIFGIADLQSLPPLREIEQMIPASQSNVPEEDPKILEMRRFIKKMSTEKTILGYNPEDDEKFLNEIRDRIKSIPTTTDFLRKQEAGGDEAAIQIEVPAGTQAKLSDLTQGFDARETGMESPVTPVAEEGADQAPSTDVSEELHASVVTSSEEADRLLALPENL